MNEDLEPSPEDAERWARNLLKGGQSKSGPTPVSATEQQMIAKVFGTKTAADHFMRSTGASRARPHVHAREADKRQRLYRPIEVRIHYEYFDRPDSDYGLGGWSIEQYQNGIKMTVQTGNDYSLRDDLLIRYQAGGFTCKPVNVAGRDPPPVRGRAKDKAKPKSNRMAIMQQVGQLTTDDLEDFE